MSTETTLLAPALGAVGVSDCMIVEKLRSWSDPPRQTHCSGGSGHETRSFGLMSCPMNQSRRRTRTGGVRPALGPDLVRRSFCAHQHLVQIRERAVRACLRQPEDRLFAVLSRQLFVLRGVDQRAGCPFSGEL